MTTSSIDFDRLLPRRIEALRGSLDGRPLALITVAEVASIAQVSYRIAQRILPIYKRERDAERLAHDTTDRSRRLFRVRGNRLWVPERCRCSGPMRHQCDACDGTGWADREITEANDITRARLDYAKTLAERYQTELSRRIEEKRRKRAAAQESRGDEIPREFPKQRNRGKYFPKFYLPTRNR